MKVEVKIGGRGRIFYNMEIDEHARVQDVLLKCKIPDGIPKLILLNGQPVKKEQKLKEGDVVSIFHLLGGG